ncbi:MAG: MJ0042-type zinc finger domain-containing protein [Candidatus Natronoplasma sp.]
MKKLFTYCPNCRAGFYVETKKREGEKVEVNCPRCQFRYGDTVDTARTKEIKYNWELYESINIGLISNEGNPLHLKIAGISLFSTLVLFSIGIVSLLILDSFTLVHKSLGLSGSIFAIFVILGIINSYKKRSFVLAFTGSLFAIFSSFIWGYLNSQGDFLIFSQHVSLPYTVLGLFLSFLALILIIKNRLIFDLGY